MIRNFAAASSTALLLGTAFAQSPESLAPTIVDAERAEHDIAAVSVLSRASIDLFQTDSFADLSGLVPGFHVVSADSRGYGQVVAMRGSTNSLFFGPPALGLIIDDVPLGDAFTYPSELLELAEARVHRGPQGPYFGRNGAAGMVELTTPGPTDTAFNQVIAEYGSYDHIGLKFLSSGPAGDQFAYSAQIFHSQRDGFIDNPLLGTATDERESTGGLMNFYWRPDTDFELRLRVFAEHVDDGSQRLSRLDSPDRFSVFSDNPGRTDLERFQISLHSRKDFASGSLETISSFQNWQLDPSTVDLDLADRLTASPAFSGFPIPADSRSTIRQQQDLISNEIRFTSPDDRPLRWQTGLFQMWTENSGDTLRTLESPLPPFGMFAPVLREANRFDIEQLNLAAFSNLAWDINDRLTFDAGLRVDYHESEIDRVQNAGPTVINPSTTVTPVAGTQDDWFVSPVLGLTYAVRPAVDVFYRSALGHKPAGFTAYSNDPRFTSFDRETNWSNEIGIQYDCPAYDLRVGFRAFYDQIDDYQLNQSVPGTTDFVVVNADEVTSRGLELDAAWAPTANLTVRGSLGYVDAEFDSFQDPTTPGGSFGGRAVPFVPEYTGSLGLRYDFDSGFFVGTSARVAGKTRYDTANTADSTQNAYIVWNAEIGYETENFSVAVFGRNLLDEGYYRFINPQVQAGSPGDPQQFGVRVSTTF